MARWDFREVEKRELEAETKRKAGVRYFYWHNKFTIRLYKNAV